MSETSNEILAERLKHQSEEMAKLRSGFDDFKKSYNANVRNGIWVVLIAAGAVLFEPFRLFWAAVQSK